MDGIRGNAAAVSSQKLAQLIERHLPPVNSGFALLPWTVHAHSTEELLEQQLRGRVERYRAHTASPSLRTVWDEELCYFMEPALAAYESERCIGHAFGNEDFQDCIRRAVPHGYQFKGYPTCFGHTNVNEMWRALTKASAVVPLDLISTKGIDVALALRVKGAWRRQDTSFASCSAFVYSLVSYFA